MDYIKTANSMRRKLTPQIKRGELYYELDWDIDTVVEGLEERDTLIDFVTRLDVSINNKKTWFRNDETGLWTQLGDDKDYLLDEVLDLLREDVVQSLKLLAKSGWGV